MKTTKNIAAIPVAEKTPGRTSSSIFAAMFGALLGLALLKFGNPVIMEQLIGWPENLYEWVLMSWPVIIGYWLLGFVALAGMICIQRRKGLPLLLIALPLIWLVWELLAATQTESPRLSIPAVVHFSSCVTCFYLGLFGLAGVRRMGFFWGAILIAFSFVMVSGFQQHFGGLADTRKYWMQYIYPSAKTIDPSLMKKMTSNRIFGTLFYPNTFAGVILLLLPMSLAFLWSLRGILRRGARLLLMAMVAAAALACLYWSGSKAGWLLMLIIGFAGAMSLPFQRRTKLILAGVILTLGLAGFTVKYVGFFKRGASSVVARYDYWQTALQIVKEKPWFGTGPGTFGKAYQERKKPEWEMARLAHNDYLQQASDSGLPGCLIYSAWVMGTLLYIGRKADLSKDWVKLSVWLGLLGWGMQSVVEFGLYIPAIAWLAFAFMGWLLGQTGIQIDSRKVAG